MIAHHGSWWGGGWGLLGALIMIAFWTLVVVLIIGLVRGGRGAGDRTSGSAIHILEERYARGEIDREEFLERRAALSRRVDPSEPPAT